MNKVDILIFFFFLFPFLVFGMGIFVGMTIKEYQMRKDLSDPKKITSLRL